MRRLLSAYILVGELFIATIVMLCVIVVVGAQTRVNPGQIGPIIPSATTLTLPSTTGQYAGSPWFGITGNTTVTAMTGAFAGQQGTFATLNGPVTFQAGASIAASCTTTSGSIYTWYFDSFRFWIVGPGCTSAPTNDAQTVRYQLPASNSQVTTVAAKLNSFYDAVADFGADPTGITASDAAFQAGCNAANSAGAVLVFPAGTYKLNVSRSYNCSINMQGGKLQPASGQTVALPVSIICPLIQPCYDVSASGSFSFAGTPSNYGPVQFGASPSAAASVNYAALMGAHNALPANPDGYTGVSGNPIRTGRLLFPSGTYQISQTFVKSAGVGLYGTADYSFSYGTGSMAYLQLASGVATSGPEYFVVVVDSPVGAPDEAFGGQFTNFGINCNAGFSSGYGGNNASASGLEFYGAQGAGWDDLIVVNCGIRGVAVPTLSGNGSGNLHVGQLEVDAIIQGPGLDLESVGNAAFDYVSIENVNPAGTYTDSDSDPNAGIRCATCFEVHFNLLSGENDYLPVKIKGGTDVIIDSLSIIPVSVAPLPVGVELTGGSQGTSIRKWFTFSGSKFFTTIINDVDNGIAIPGNLSTYPEGGYEQQSPTSYHRVINILGTQSNSNSVLTFITRYTNAVPAIVAQTWTIFQELASGTSPGYSYLWIKPPTAAPQSGFGLRELSAATSMSGNISSTPFIFRGSYWNGSSAVFPSVSLQYNLTSGTSPGGTLVFTGSGVNIFAAPEYNYGTLFYGSGANAIPLCGTAPNVATTEAWVSDGKASPTYGGVYAAADGSANAKVGCDGTNWRYGY